jgi:phosphoketolase
VARQVLLYGAHVSDRGMVMLTDMNRCPLVMDVIDRMPGLGTRAAQLRIADERLRHLAYTREVRDDPPDVRGWTWPVADAPRSPAPKRGAPA